MSRSAGKTQKHKVEMGELLIQKIFEAIKKMRTNPELDKIEYKIATNLHERYSIVIKREVTE